MSRPTSIMLTEATDRQIEALKQLGFGGLTDIVRIAIDRMYIQEATMNQVDSVTYRYGIDDAAMFGADADMSTVDVEASYASYEQQIEDALRDAYPGAEITVESGSDAMMVCGDRDHDEVRNVQEIVHQIWENWDWIVESTARDVTYQFWDDQAGETYAVRLVDGDPTHTSGPLHYSEVDEDELPNYNYDDPWGQEDPEEWRLHRQHS